MDPNDKLAAAAAAAAVDSLAQLELNRHTGDGPINLLPSEMMQIILTKLEQAGAVKSLIRLRIVSTRMLLIVDDYRNRKKSLIVNCDSKRFSKLSNDSKIYAPLFVSLKSARFFGTMLKQFPNIEKLKIGMFSESRLELTKIRDIAAEIDSMSSLKHLELVGKYVSVVPFLTKTLSKLEFIGINELYHYLNEKELLQMVSQLGPDCVCVDLGEANKLDYRHIRKWHQINPNWLANLTHLTMSIDKKSEKHAKVVRYLSEHATLLKLLKIHISYKSLKLTPSLIDVLGKLTHLAEFEFYDITMNMPKLEEAAAQHRLTSLASILTCTLYVFNVRGLTSADRFIRVLSVIFPNLINLKLRFSKVFSPGLQFQQEIQQHLNRFPNLRKHEIEF